MTIWSPPTPLARPGTPIYLALAHAIEADVLAGRLSSGEQLPTLRELADRLKVTVGTVARGYAEARRAGWISGEVGRGTYVRNRSAGRFAARPERAGDVVDLSLNMPIETPAPDLAAAMRALAKRSGIQPLLRYTSSDSRSDRLAGAMVLERHGLRVDADDVLLCAGTQHGLGVALEAVALPGDTILAEELTYPTFHALADARGLRIHPVALDEHGIVPAAFDAACRRLRPKLLYVMSTLQNPTTATLPAARRDALVEIARRHDVMILEDDVYGMLAPEGAAPLATRAPERTLYVTSLSKCFAPGLRLGYMTGPAAIRSRLARAVQQSMWMVSPITTALGTYWVQSGEFDAIVAGKRREAEARQNLAAKILPRKLLHTSRGAYHAWLETPRGGDAFALRARAVGVLVSPASAFWLGSRPAPDAVRISLSAAADRSQLVAALEKLRAVVDEGGSAKVARL